MLHGKTGNGSGRLSPPGLGVHDPPHHNRNLGPIAQQSLQFYHRVFTSGPLQKKILSKIAHILWIRDVYGYLVLVLGLL